MKNRNTLLQFVCILIAVSICLCGCGHAKETVYSKDIFDTFDTIIRIMISCNSEEEFNEAFKTAEDAFNRYNQLFDIYNEYPGINNIKTINDNAGIKEVSVDSEIIELLEYGIKMHKDTLGNMNIAFGSVLSIWHEAREDAASGVFNVPSKDVLLKAALHSNIEDIVIDKEKNTVYLKDPLMSIDVGAVAKGFASDKVSKVLKDKGFDSFLISAGNSSILTSGKKPDGTNWRVSVETDPMDNIYKLCDYSITTSGSYQRYYEADGIRYHHIINKDSLMPENNFLSVTVISKDCSFGDSAATAVFNMTLEEGKKYVASLGDVYVMWVLNDASRVVSEGFDNFID